MKDERRKRSSSLESACFCLVQGFESCNRIDSIFMGSGEVGPPFTMLCVAKTTISPLQNLSISFFLSLSSHRLMEYQTVKCIPRHTHLEQGRVGLSL